MTSYSSDRGYVQGYNPVGHGRIPAFWQGNQMTDTNKIIGRIIKINRTGWGFISSKDIQFTRIFFHWTALQQNTTPFLELRIGMNVEFTPVQVPLKGWRAVHVRVVEHEKETPHEPPTTEMPTLSE